MILSSAALVGAYWERLRVLPLEQRRVAGREPRSEQRSEGQPGYSEELQAHLHRHPVPITAIQHTATRLTHLLCTDIRATRSPAMDIPATRDTPPTPVPRLLDTPMPDTRPTPVLHAMATRADRHTLPIPVPGMEVPWLVQRFQNINML